MDKLAAGEMLDVAAEGQTPERVSVAATAERGPWQLMWERHGTQWRLIQAAPIGVCTGVSAAPRALPFSRSVDAESKLYSPRGPTFIFICSRLFSDLKRKPPVMPATAALSVLPHTPRTCVMPPMFAATPANADTTVRSQRRS